MKNDHANILLKVKVKPNSKKNEVLKREDHFIVSVAVPPVEGKANEKVIELLSEYLGEPKSSFKILHGLTSRNKIIELKGS
ncbi:MAG: DUF167 domain-containing protein [Proteobacteria bacterium]|nr:DUF167 domain-containing protein [Pseudomonadota bacterium]